MLIRSKTSRLLSIFTTKTPKIELIVQTYPTINPERLTTAKVGYGALIANNTWTLMPQIVDMHLVGCK